ncbi:site-specific DNA-methyltransferase [Actinomyces sp. B33]|uniref:site-specific DNA-methyltransferase n=1 Tax=Actinomyces sp. B33 TaxID=2942131 RepID=UPI002341456A|nr:site-specific DNA-methyltransferase [Actinomyces sp. B33]MDC4233165.1 site-specific DNA-methyltransferase [Actinomyces sp. B33]
MNFETTKNIFIEGDNLEALKLLQESYLGKVKLIYIDPPYNTGHDFIYNDDFAETRQEYLERSGQVDDSGARLVANTESNGRFHSDWLSMMYPRLKLARNLLKSDGVFVMSISDVEVANARSLLDEIFGERNLVSQVVVKARASISNDKIISESHSHLLIYARDVTELDSLRSSIGIDPDLSGFSNPDGDSRGAWKAVPLDGPGGAKKGNPYYEFLGVKGFWRYSERTMQEKYEEGLIVRSKNGLQQKYFLSQACAKRKTVSSWWDDCGLNSTATRRLSLLMGGSVFDTPKPLELLVKIIKMFTFGESVPIVFDFFCGSSTMGHALLSVNAEDGARRRFVMVQLDEKTDPKLEAAKAGYSTIAELSRERIRRAGRKILEESGKSEDELDIGFRAFRIDSSNRLDVQKSADETVQSDLLSLTSGIETDRTSLDLLIQVMLEWGLELSLPIVRDDLAGREVFFVADDAVAACFEESVALDLVREIAERQPLRAVFRDDAFASDAERINVEQVFRELSPVTDLKVI